VAGILPQQLGMRVDLREQWARLSSGEHPRENWLCLAQRRAGSGGSVPAIRFVLPICFLLVNPGPQLGITALAWS